MVCIIIEFQNIWDIGLEWAFQTFPFLRLFCYKYWIKFGSNRLQEIIGNLLGKVHYFHLNYLYIGCRLQEHRRELHIMFLYPVCPYNRHK